MVSMHWRTDLANQLGCIHIGGGEECYELRGNVLLAICYSVATVKMLYVKVLYLWDYDGCEDRIIIFYYIKLKSRLSDRQTNISAVSASIEMGLAWNESWVFWDNQVCF